MRLEEVERVERELESGRKVDVQKESLEAFNMTSGDGATKAR